MARSCVDIALFCARVHWPKWLWTEEGSEDTEEGSEGTKSFIDHLTCGLWSKSEAGLVI